LLNSSSYQDKYQERIERRTASEILEERMVQHDQEEAREQEVKEAEKASKSSTSSRSTRQTPFEAAKNQASRTLAREGAKLLGKIATGILNSIFKKR